MNSTTEHKKHPALIGLGTAVPPHILTQHDAQSYARQIFACRTDQFDRMAKVFPNTGIDTRHTVCPLEWYLKPHNWPERTQAFVEGAQTLYADAVQAALAAAALQACEIDTIVFTCSTGIATPGIEAITLSKLGFREDVKRVPVFGLGCAGGVSGLSLAARLAQNSDDIVLLVALELCSLAFRSDQVSKSNIVATALFGDGAAAAIVTSAPDFEAVASLEFAGEHTWPETLDIMGWDVDEIGFSAIFSRSIPQLTKERVAGVVDGFLHANHLTRDDLSGYTFHPGGNKVIEALESALLLHQGQLQPERNILRKFGNMSGPTALFVLKEALASGLGGRRLLSALGPGFTQSMMTVTPPATS